MTITQDQYKFDEFVKKDSQAKLTNLYRVVLATIGGIPLSLGMKLRSSMYSLIFANWGSNIQIQHNVEFNRTYWIEIGSGVYIRSGANIAADGLNSWIKIGNKSRLERGVDIRVHDEGLIVIGDRTNIGPYTCLSGRNIVIGNDCLIASHTGIYANNHIYSDPNRKIKEQGRSYQGIVIEDDCWLGSGVRVVDGVRIGKGSVIGAGAVVTKDIPPYSIAVGVPAKVISQRMKSD
ncbi:acyltransferase [Okeania sp.]|uniref:acyltransferase n=1 Tax=Okeania sp. TaxID=3100323 RepID=UPI002B4B60B6|nr:acyltransferase [Okeania sp.]MEB3341989.1 acyltransferase [Okeania sp.]